MRGRLGTPKKGEITAGAVYVAQDHSAPTARRASEHTCFGFVSVSVRVRCEAMREGARKRLGLGVKSLIGRIFYWMSRAALPMSYPAEMQPS